MALKIEKGDIMKKTVMLLMTAVLLLLPTQSRALLEMGIGAWDQNIKGDLYYNIYTTAPDKADLADDLDLKSDARGVGYLKLELPVLPSLYMGFTPMEFRGTEAQEQPFVFGDNTYLADRPMRTRMQLNHFDIGLYYSLPMENFASLKKVKVDLGINLRSAELDVAVTGAVATADGGETIMRESESYNLPIPMLYGAVQITPVERFSLEFEGRGATLKSDSLVSLLGKVKIRTWKALFVAVGYRYDYIRLDEDDLNVDSTVSGVFCETGLEF
jgi:outer membrane protein